MIWTFGFCHLQKLSISRPLLDFNFISVFQAICELSTVPSTWSRPVQRKARPSPPTIVIIVIMHVKRCAKAAVCIYTSFDGTDDINLHVVCGTNIAWKKIKSETNCLSVWSPVEAFDAFKSVVPCSSNHLFTLGRNHNNESRFMFAWIIFAMFEQ